MTGDAASDAPMRGGVEDSDADRRVRMLVSFAPIPMGNSITPSPPPSSDDSSCADEACRMRDADPLTPSVVSDAVSSSSLAPPDSSGNITSENDDSRRGAEGVDVGAVVLARRPAEPSAPADAEDEMDAAWRRTGEPASTAAVTVAADNTSSLPLVGPPPPPPYPSNGCGVTGADAPDSASMAVEFSLTSKLRRDGGEGVVVGAAEW